MFGERFRINREGNESETYVVLDITLDPSQKMEVEYLRQCVEEIIGSIVSMMEKCAEIYYLELA